MVYIMIWGIFSPFLTSPTLYDFVISFISIVTLCLSDIKITQGSAHEAVICASFIWCFGTFRHSAIYTIIAKFHYFWNVASVKISDPSHVFQLRKYSTLWYWLKASQKSTKPNLRNIFSPILHLWTASTPKATCHNHHRNWYNVYYPLLDI